MYRRLVETPEGYCQAIEITTEEARELIIAARVEFTGVLDAYYKMAGMPTLSRIYSVDLPDEWKTDLPSDEVLLQYARQNLPRTLLFGLE